MATIFLEPGGDATFDLSLWSTNNGTVALDSGTVHGGHQRSIRFRPAITNYLVKSNVVADAGGRVSIYYYISALPTSTQSIFSLEKTGDGNAVCTLRLTSGGVLQLANNAGTQVGSNGSTLSTGTWYRLCLAWTITSTTVNQLMVFKDGATDISVTNGTLTDTASADFAIGTGSDTTNDWRLSDVYIDNSSALTDPGNIWVTAKRPNANGTANAFTTQIGSGGSGYGTGHSPQVNERPLSTTNGWSLSNTTKATEEYNIENISTGDINITGATIVDYMGWINSSVNSTSNSPVHHIILNNVATSITESTSSQIFTVIAGSTTYPAGTGTDIGIDAQFTTTPHLTSLFEAGVVVAYIPASGSTVNLRKLLLGVGI